MTGARRNRVSRSVTAALNSMVVKRRRSSRAQRAVDASLGRTAAASSADSNNGFDIFEAQGAATLTRPQRLAVEIDAGAGPPPARTLTFRAGMFRVMARLAIFTGGVLRWYAGRFADRLHRRDTLERRAVRLRGIIESIGGTTVKVGQQMAMRVDLLPYVYGLELSKMLDDVPPFPVEQAIERIEKQTGKPLGATFARFDREPVGSASVACVYQAILHNGDKVAIKVRRPRIGELFAADCRALSMVLGWMEHLTLMRPGLSHNFLYEFRTMLFEELDFVREARNTELFRRGVRKNLRKVTAPRVHFELSGDDVLVLEFVSGVWLKDVIAAVEHNDEVALQFLRRHHIEPRSLARKLIRTNQYGIFENLLFHADPHPSNVLVRPDNTLVFIDFGACGAYTEKERANWRELARCHHREDVGGMVQNALAILEPLPPIDIDDFSKRLEQVFWQDLYAFKSKHSLWYERTSARIWISFLELAREYNIPMNLNTLRMIRSTLLYETVAARINPRINAWREHRRFNRSAGKRARKRVRKHFFRRIFGGLTNEDYLQVEQTLVMGQRALHRFQRLIDAPPYRFSMLIGKAVYAVTTTIHTAFVLAATTAGLVAVVWLLGKADLAGATAIVVQSGWWWLYAAVVLFVGVRRMLYRFGDKEVRRDNSSGLS